MNSKALTTLAFETQALANKVLGISMEVTEGGIESFDEFNTEDFMKLTHELANNSTTMLCGIATTVADIQDRLDKIEEKL